MRRKKPAKKRPVPREGLERPFAGGAWTSARFKAFVMTALRGARWGEKYRCIDAAFVRKGINPATGKPCQLHRCEKCQGLFPKGKIQADHIVPVMGPEGFVSWDLVVERMFVGREGFRALCKPCHQLYTNMERFKLDERAALIRAQAIDFGKQSTTEQVNLLQSLGCPQELCVNAKLRRKSYEHHLTHGTFTTSDGHSH